MHSFLCNSIQMYFIPETLCSNFVTSNKTAGETNVKPKIWVVAAGIVVYWIPEVQRLYATNVTSKEPASSRLFYLDEKFPSPVVDLHFGDDYIFVVLQNAFVHVYLSSCDQNRIIWKKTLTFRLRIPRADVFVRSVAFHENLEFVSWCDEECDSCQVFWRSLPSFDSCESRDEIKCSGAAHLILSNGPVQSVKCIGNVICVIPRKPVNILLTVSTTGLIRMLNLDGKLLWLSSGQLPVDFWDLLKSTFGLWESHADYVICENLNLNQKLFSCLTRKGIFLSFNKNGCLHKKLNLNIPEDSIRGIPLGMCLYSKFVCIFFMDRFCIYWSENGKLVQNTQLAQFGPLLGTWVSVSLGPTFGFYVERQIYRMRTTTLSGILNSNNGIDSSLLLSGTFYNDSAFLTSLQSAVNKKELPRVEELMSVAPPLQSPAILLALLQHCCNLKDRRNLIQALNRCIAPGTKLDRQLRPFVEHFLSLEKCREQLNDT